MVVAVAELIKKSVVSSINIVHASQNTASCGCSVMGPVTVSST